MTGTIIKCDKKMAKTGGPFFYLFFTMTDGKSAKTCIYPHFGNFKKWWPIIESLMSGTQVTLSGLNFKRGRLINADSQFLIEGFQKASSFYGGKQMKVGIDYAAEATDRSVGDES